jgi:CheY-like chemotaxis protein
MKTTTTKNIVLYADDDLDDQYIVQEAFRQFDDSIEVVCLPNGKKAMDYLDNLLMANFLPCLVILDINMPIQDGKKTLQEIRESELLKDLPVVLFTTSSNPADETFAYQHKAGFITKPTAVNDLHSIASHFISHCRQELSGKV